MTRLFLMMVGLAFAGSVLMVGCEPPPDNKTTPPAVPPAKAPEKPTTPPAPSTPTTPPAKTGALTIPGAAEGVASVNSASIKVTAATTCALAGCTAAGNPSTATTLVKDGKPLMFCSADCMSKYKTANNIQ